MPHNVDTFRFRETDRTIGKHTASSDSRTRLSHLSARVPAQHALRANRAPPIATRVLRGTRNALRLGDRSRQAQSGEALLRITGRTVFRHDFNGGVPVVNATYAAQTVELGRTYRRDAQGFVELMNTVSRSILTLTVCGTPDVVLDVALLHRAAALLRGTVADHHWRSAAQS